MGKILKGSDQVAKAFKVASTAHRHSFFDDSTPKMVHVARVFMLCPPYDYTCQTVALLHDTIESGNVTAKDLIEAGFDLKIVKAVVTLSKSKGETYDTYIQRIIDSDDELTINTKIRDLYDKLMHVSTRNVPLDDDRLADLVRYQAIWLKLSMLAEEKGWVESADDVAKE
jgi:hypothetical protein